MVITNQTRLKLFELLKLHAIIMEEMNGTYLCFSVYLFAADFVNSTRLMFSVITA